MTDFRISPGPYRPDTELPPLLGRRQPPAGDPDHPFARYEGPHGPMDAFAVDGATVTEVRGPTLAQPVRLAWGLEAKSDSKWVERLVHGIPCRIGATDVVFRQSRFGLTRDKRGVHVEAGPRQLVARLRRYKTYVVERADGSGVARYPWRGEVGWMDAAADQFEAVVVLLLDASLLRLECNAGNA